jgi:hypothetical protein
MNTATTYQTIIRTFLITALYDVVLQLYTAVPSLPDPIGITKTDWFLSLPLYFEKHTPLAAALLAGFIGACTQMVILHIAPINTGILKFLIATFVVSGLIGFAMKATGMFPILDATYYRTLGPTRAFFTDAYSGVVVNVTLLALLKIFG